MSLVVRSMKLHKENVGYYKCRGVYYTACTNCICNRDDGAATCGSDCSSNSCSSNCSLVVCSSDGCSSDGKCSPYNLCLSIECSSNRCLSNKNLAPAAPSSVNSSDNILGACNLDAVLCTIDCTLDTCKSKFCSSNLCLSDSCSSDSCTSDCSSDSYVCGEDEHCGQDMEQPKQCTAHDYATCAFYYGI